MAELESLKIDRLSAVTHRTRIEQKETTTTTMKSRIVIIFLDNIALNKPTKQSSDYGNS